MALLASALGGSAALREPVHPRRNVETFGPVEARFIRFTVRATNRGEPCLDELEIYPPNDEVHNLALAVTGARATASGSLRGYAIHNLEGVNDGRYGNGRSWIAERVDGAWVQIELPQATRIGRIVWGRDREGNFIDRLPTQYEIAVATDLGAWRVVASSADREPLPVGATLGTSAAMARSLVNRFAPVSTSLPGESGPGPGEYRVDVWQTADGLPGNTVTAIQQTGDGYLWVGTLAGLVRFDGVRFQELAELRALPSRRVLALLAARDGALWIGLEGGGLARWRDGRLLAVGRRDGLPGDTVTSLSEDGRGRLWVATSGGLACWAEEKFFEDPVMPSLRGVAVSLVASSPPAGAGRAEELWVVADGRLRTRSGPGPLVRPQAADPSLFSSVLTAALGRSGKIWYGGPNGYIGSVSNGVVNVYGEQPGQLLETVWALTEARNGDVWAGTANGGLRRLRGGRFSSLTTVEGLSDNSVRSVYEDREGNLWVGTVGGGLNRVKQRKLTTYTTRDGLSHNVVMSLAQDPDGRLWVGSNCGGLSVRRGENFTPYYTSYLLDNECIWSVLSSADGAIWAGTWGGGLYRLRGKEVVNFPVTRNGTDDAVISLEADSKGDLWVGTMQGGLKRFRAEQVVEDLGTNGLPAFPITALQHEAKGLWIGTGGGGLYFFDGRGPAHPAPGLAGHLPSPFVRTLHRDSSGVLWIGTSGGMARWDGARLASFGRAQGLPDDVISQILEDGLGHLWVGSNRGIFRVSLRELAEVAGGGGVGSRVNVVVYGRAEGLESLECTGGFHPAGLRTRDGRLWFSTVKGLATVDPATVPLNELAPPVVVERVVVDGVARPLPAPGRSLVLEPGRQRVEFEFTALSLVAPEQNRFRCRLAGLESDWVELGPQRLAVYPGLGPGRYEFRVVGCNNDGVWNLEGAAVRLEVQPWFWQAWWFRGVAGILVLGGGMWLVRTMAVRRLRRRLHRLQERHAVDRERARIAEDIHDELGANLTRIALLAELGQQHARQPEDVSGDLQRISASAREAARAMDAIVWAVNPRNDSLDHFANYVSQYAEEFLRPTSMRCRLDIPADLPEHPLSTEARHHLFLAVKEALNNVVRHSGAGEVRLRLATHDGRLEITISDNGHGMDPGPGDSSRAAGTGHEGLGNIRRRIESLGGRFELETGPAGTTVRLHLPLSASGGTGRAGGN